MATSLTEGSRTQKEQHGPRKSGKAGGNPMVRWLSLALLVLVAAALLFFFGWLPRHRETNVIDREAQQRSEALPRLNVVTVKRAPTNSELMVPGTTLAFTEAYIYARASGYVSKRLVDIGDHVRKGQLLATIDAPDLDRQVAQARSNLAQSEAALIQVQAQEQLASLTWNRWKVLVAKGVFSRQEGDQQEANYRVAVSNVNAARSSIEANRQNLNRLVVLQGYEQVTAPFAGVVTARNVDVGALISSGGSGLGSSPASDNPGALTTAGAQGNNQGSSGVLSSNATPSTGGAQGGQMFTIASIDRLRVLVSVPEAYSSAIRVGQKANAVFQEKSNGGVQGRVTRTSASIDQNTRTLLVEVQVVNTGKLVPGMYVNVNFVEVKTSPPLIIPGAAIVVRNGRNMVATVDNQIVHIKPISIGRDYGDQTEVTGGLHDGEAVVLDVTDEVQEGLKIDPQFQRGQAQQSGAQHGSSQNAQGGYGDQKLDDQAQKSSKGGGRGKGSSAGNSSQSQKQ